VRAAGYGAGRGDASEDVSLGFRDAVGRADPLELAALLRRRALHRGGGWAAEPLALQRWALPGRPDCVCGLVAGCAAPTLAEELLSAGAPAPPPAACLLTAGEAPAFGAWAGPEASGGVLAAAAALAASAVGAAARAARRLVPWARAPPPPPPPGEEEEAAAAGEARAALHDPPRRGRVLALAPAARLAAGGDSLGRVLLFELGEGGALAPLRLWKGAREAGLAWAGLPAGRPAALLVHTPRRGGLLEAWAAPDGGRVAVRRGCAAAVAAGAHALAEAALRAEHAPARARARAGGGGRRGRARRVRAGRGDWAAAPGGPQRRGRCLLAAR